jgi:hypothetical protein
MEDPIALTVQVSLGFGILSLNVPKENQFSISANLPYSELESRIRGEMRKPSFWHEVKGKQI